MKDMKSIVETDNKQMVNNYTDSYKQEVFQVIVPDT